MLVQMRLKIRGFQTMIKKWRSKILKRLGYIATVSNPFREVGGAGGDCVLHDVLSDQK